MICSAAELGWAPTTSGIMVLPPGTAEPGDSGVDVLGLDDVVFDLAITPDRGYGLSVRGIAREIACAYDLNFVDPADVAPLPVDGDAWPLTVDAGTGVSRFALRPVTGIDQHALSPWWLRRRLMLCGIRPISPAVDVTNYVMLEFGHPMHAHDRDRIHGGFRVRFAEPGETVLTLDDVERTLDPADVLIVDQVATAAIGGVMGAGSTEIGDDSTDVLLEAAVWDPAAVSRTQRRLRLVSEAGRRYERGVDPAVSVAALDRCAALLGRDRRWGRAADADRLARRPAPRRLVAARGEDGGRPARPHGRRDLRRRRDRRPTDPDRCPGAGGPGRSGGVGRHPAELASRPGAAGRPRRGGAAPGGSRRDPVGAARRPGRPRADRHRRSAAAPSASRWRCPVTSRSCRPRSCPPGSSTPGVWPPTIRAATPRSVLNPLEADRPQLATTLLPGLLEALVRNVSRGSVDTALFAIAQVVQPHRTDPRRRAHPDRSPAHRRRDRDAQRVAAAPAAARRRRADRAARAPRSVGTRACRRGRRRVRGGADHRPRRAAWRSPCAPRSTCRGIRAGAPRCSWAATGRRVTPGSCIPRSSSARACRRAPARWNSTSTRSRSPNRCRRRGCRRSRRCSRTSA